METTLKLNGMEFKIDKYAKMMLEEYLKDIETSLPEDENKDEIIVDIKGRIAELLGKEQGVIGVNAINKIMEQIGPAENFTDGEMIVEEPKQKRLRRDTCNKLLGGVCAGLAKYFNIDPVLMRLLFVIATFFYGMMLIIYPVLWIIMPKEEEGKRKKSDFVWIGAKVILFLIAIIMCIPLFFIFLGLLFILISFIVGSFDFFSVSNLIPEISYVPYNGMILWGYGVLVLLLVALPIFAFVLWKKERKNAKPKRGMSFTILIIWLISLCCLGFLFNKYPLDNYWNTIATQMDNDFFDDADDFSLGLYKTKTILIDELKFNGIATPEGGRIMLRTDSVKAEEMNYVGEYVTVDVVDSVLQIVCSDEDNKVFLAIPNGISFISADSESEIMCNDTIKTKNLRLYATDDSKVRLIVDVENLDIVAKDDSRVTISGKAKNIKKHNSKDSRIDVSGIIRKS